MLKSALFAGAMMVAVPAFAQQADTPKPTAPTSAPGAAIVPETLDQSTADKKDSPKDKAEVAAAAAGTDHVSTIVDAEFASYDKDGSGTLEKAEFIAWMDAMKARAPERKKPGSDTWNNAAFAQADKDKSTSLSKDELTGFLRG